MAVPLAILLLSIIYVSLKDLQSRLEKIEKEVNDFLGLIENKFRGFEKRLNIERRLTRIETLQESKNLSKTGVRR